MKTEVQRRIRLIALTLITVLALSACQGPTETSPSQERTSTMTKETPMSTTNTPETTSKEVTGTTSKRIRLPKQAIRGVNLGSWLLLERWMVPELFESNHAKSNDEYRFMDELGDRKEAVMKEHYDTFIVEDDFAWLKDHGINNVRIPVGYWIFDGKDHFVANVEYLDKAFEWAEKYDIEVLIDLHGVRDSQNGFDNSGLEGKVGWHKKQENIDEAVEILGQLAERYKDHPALFGVGLLNEPSWEIPMPVLRDFYLDGYEAVMQHLDRSKHWVVIHDGFRFQEWKDFMQDDYYNNVILDTHMYHVFEDEDKTLDIYDQLRKAAGPRADAIETMSTYFPVIVGEWSLGLHGDKLAAVGSKDQQDHALRAFANTQLLAYGQSAGWYFWSYKQSAKATGDGSGWNYHSGVDRHWLPTDVTYRP